MTDKKSILIVDDDEITCKILNYRLGSEGYETNITGTGREAIEKARERFFNVSLLDIMLPDVEGIELIAPLKEMHPDMEMIVITAHASVENAVRALNEGAISYITKPLNMDEVLATVSEALKKQHLVIENRRLYQEARRELSERRRSEEALRESEKKYRELTDLLPQTVFEIDGRGKLTFFNRHGFDSTGYSQMDLDRGLRGFKLLVPGDRKGIKDYVRRILKGEEVNGEEFRGLRKNGSPFHMIIYCSPVIREGKPSGIRGVVIDISDRKRAEEERVHLQKMGALGTLTAGIAHELNNPMMGMLNFIQYCIKKTSQGDKRYTVLQDAERETKRCIGIVKNLLTFSRVEKEDEEKYQKQSLPSILDRVFNLLSYRIEKENITLTREYAEDTPEVEVKPSNIQQVFLNIVGNALDAMNGIDKKEVRVVIRPEGKYVMVAIADTGSGVEVEDFPNIFDPFFTTKPTGQGTGLGLSICYNIVTAHGGEITCEDHDGTGTEFKILLPMERS